MSLFSMCVFACVCGAGGLGGWGIKIYQSLYNLNKVYINQKANGLYKIYI